MPSRLPPLPSPAPPPHHLNHHPLSPPTSHLIPPIAAAAASFSLLILIAVLYRKLNLSRTAPAPSSSSFPDDNHQQPKLRRFPFSLLRKSTASFSASNRLGQGGFGSVYRAAVPSTGELLAVKLMDSAGSIQAEREFHNELSLASRIISAVGSPSSPFLVSILGYSSSSRGERKLLVYELMANGSH